MHPRERLLQAREVGTARDGVEEMKAALALLVWTHREPCEACHPVAQRSAMTSLYPSPIAKLLVCLGVKRSGDSNTRAYAA